MQTAMKKHLEWLKCRVVISKELEETLLKQEEEQNYNSYNEGYLQGREDMAFELNNKKVIIRQEGYYWVKYNGDFEIAFWWSNNNCWYLNAEKTKYQDSDFEHINEVRIKQPGELPEF